TARSTRSTRTSSIRLFSGCCRAVRSVVERVVVPVGRLGVAGAPLALLALLLVPGRGPRGRGLQRLARLVLAGIGTHQVGAPRALGVVVRLDPARAGVVPVLHTHLVGLLHVRPGHSARAPRIHPMPTITPLAPG